MQINTGSHEWLIMSWTDEVSSSVVPDWIVKISQKAREGNRFWVIRSFAKTCRAFMSCFVVWGLVLAPTVRGAQRVCPGLLGSLASPCYLVRRDEQEPRERSDGQKKTTKKHHHQTKTWTGKEESLCGLNYPTLLPCFQVLVELLGVTPIRVIFSSSMQMCSAKACDMQTRRFLPGANSRPTPWASSRWGI